MDARAAGVGGGVITCDAPDANLGLALRLSSYLDCQSRAIGENGFQALAGGPIGTGLLSGLVTIFVALIGYRLILGRTPDLADGIGLTVRLGVVLALVTSWPAFQTLAYRVAVDGPVELAGVLLPAAGLPSAAVDARIQAAYDTVALGSPDTVGTNTSRASTTDPNAGASQAVLAQSAAPTQPVNAGAPRLAPLPQTASLFLLATAGITGALRVAVGFLLAIGPLAVLGLLFDATLGLFSGWLRALAGSALASLAALVTSTLSLVLTESELAHEQAYVQGLVPGTLDGHALTTLAGLSALLAVAGVWAAARATGALRIEPRLRLLLPSMPSTDVREEQSTAPTLARIAATAAKRVESTGPSRARAIATSLAAAAGREPVSITASTSVSSLSGQGRPAAIAQAAMARSVARAGPEPLGVSGRRALPRRSRGAAARDAL